MGTVVLILIATGISYALNTWKIRQIACGHRLAATVLEGFQAAGFLLVVARIAASPGGYLGLAAYIIGAMLGTAITARVSTRRRGASGAVMAVAKVTPDRSCRLVEKPCPWCGGRPDHLQQAVVLLSAGHELAYGYRCPWCGSCVLRPADVMSHTPLIDEPDAADGRVKTDNRIPARRFRRADSTATPGPITTGGAAEGEEA